MSKNTESTSLLHQPINEDPNIHRKKTKHCQRFCLPSKSATLMLFWTAVVGTVCYFVLIVTVALIDSKPETIDIHVSLSTNDFLAYAILAIIAMVYPFSGLIADVYCGRLKTVQMKALKCKTLGYATQKPPADAHQKNSETPSRRSPKELRNPQQTLTKRTQKPPPDTHIKQPTTTELPRVHLACFYS